MTKTLFPISEDKAKQASDDRSRGIPRLQRPNRKQLSLRPSDLESSVGPDDPVRAVWEFVEGLELSPLYTNIRAVEGHAGRTPVDPAILMALWLYATIEGVGSARALARLCERHDAYRWICGGVSVSYHSLADFRVEHGELLDDLLTQSPAYNGQFAVDTKTQVVVGVDVSNSGSDQDKMPLMVEQLRERYGKAPEEILVDGGFASHNAIEKVSKGEQGCTVYAPLPKPKDKTRDAHVSLPEDSEIVASWRIRMGTPEAKAIYKERASTVECVNAIARNRGLQRFFVRGYRKVKAALLWYALAHNLMRAIALRRAIPAAAG
jgi:transposase